MKWCHLCTAIILEEESTMKWNRFKSTALALLTIMFLCAAGAVFAADVPVPSAPGASPEDEEEWDDDYYGPDFDVTNVTRELISGYVLNNESWREIKISLVEGAANINLGFEEFEKLSPLDVRTFVNPAAGKLAFEFRPSAGIFFDLDTGYIVLAAFHSEVNAEDTGFVGGKAVAIGNDYYMPSSGSYDGGSSGDAPGGSDAGSDGSDPSGGSDTGGSGGGGSESDQPSYGAPSTSGGGGGCEAGMGGVAVVFAGLLLAAKRKRGYSPK
jgi:hypothetical protein